MTVYDLIQELCMCDPNREVIIRVNGKCDSFMEYIEDSQNCAVECAEIWATVYAVKARKDTNNVFVVCDLSRL